MLQANEVLRHLLAEIDGKTNSPHGFTGPIGTELKHCEILPIVSFAPIIASIDSVEMEELISEALTMLSPGNLNFSRWLTTDNRIENPSDNLLCLAYFVMPVYDPIWFTMKANSHVQNGAKHVLQTVKIVLKQNTRI